MKSLAGSRGSAPGERNCIVLKLKYLVENFELARMALQSWRHDADTLEERLRWFRISSNAVYPFDREGRLCFLRLSPAEEKEEEALRGELALLGELERLEYPAMCPIPADGGEMLLTLDTPWGRWYACAFRGVPGQPLEELPMTQELAERYGAALGELHAAAMSLPDFPVRRDERDVLKWVTRTLAALGAPDAMLREAAEVSRLLDAQERRADNYGFVHYDFEPDNVFWDGSRFHVIDFEDGMRHFLAMDWVQAMDEIPETYHDSFIAGYRQACPASGAELRQLPLMRRFRDLYSYARLLHCLSERPEGTFDWLTTLTKRLQWRVSELEAAICGRKGE